MVFAPDDGELVWIDETEVQREPAPIRQLYHDFCVRRGGKLGCPTQFNMMTTSWYVNESTTAPNLVVDEHFHFFAARDIGVDEELLVNYQTYSE